ncbi:MAG: hypothetical protein AAB345_05000 [Patescibacteria group bacterium]
MTATLKQAKKLLEIFEGVSGDRLQKLVGSGLLADLRDADLDRINRDEFRKICQLVPNFKHFKVPQGWEIVEPGPARRITDVSKLELKSFLKKGESYINGEVMKQRAKDMNCDLGQEDLEYFLEHQEEIPKKFRDPSIYLVFPGTVVESPDGDRRVACLGWSGDQWCLGFHWLDRVWRSSGRLVCFGK